MPEPPSTISVLLLSALAAGSFAVWTFVIARWRLGQSPLPRAPREPAQWHPAVVLLAFGWIGLGFLDRLSRALGKGETSAEPPPLPTVEQVMSNVAQMAVVLLFFLLALYAQSPRRTLADYGITFRRFGWQAGIAAAGFLGSLTPVALVLALMAPFRDPQTQHSLLRMVREDSASWRTIAAVTAAAVILAPLLEELLMRVMVQGWLTTRIPETPAIVATALLFSFSHGWRDGMPLIPLALILGIVYQRTHRYFAVVLLHALFNGTMLVLQLLAE